MVLSPERLFFLFCMVSRVWIWEIWGYLGLFGVSGLLIFFSVCVCGRERGDQGFCVGCDCENGLVCVRFCMWDRPGVFLVFVKIVRECEGLL